MKTRDSEVLIELWKRKTPLFFRSISGSMLFILLVLLFLGYFIKYPDYLECTINIISNNHSKTIIALETGEISLYTKDFSNVKKGQVLAIINSSSQNYLRLKPVVDSLNTNRDMIFQKDFVITENVINLGELQPIYLDFLRYRNDYFILTTLQSKRKRLEDVTHSLSIRYSLLDNLRIKKGVLGKKLANEKDKLEKDKILFEQDVISEEDYMNALDKYYSYESSVLEISIDILSAQSDIANVQNNIETLRNEIVEDSLKAANNLHQAFERLNGEIKKWEYAYTLRSPSDGQLFFTSHWSESQIIKAGEIFGTVSPNNIGEIFCEAHLTTQRYGELNIGQKVKIQLDGYSFEKFGFLNGIIKDYSKVPNIDNNGLYSYKVNIELPNGLITTQGYEIGYMPNLSGKAKIVTKDLTILNRVFYKLKRIQGI